MLKKSVLIVLVVLSFLMLSLPVLAEDQNQVIAVVKGQNVTLGQLDQMMDLDNFMMQLYQTNAEFTQLLFSTEAGQKFLNEYRKSELEKYIAHLLLVMDAKEKGIKLTNEKIDAIFNDQVQQIMSENNLTQEELVQALQQQGIESLEKYKAYFVEKAMDSLLVGELQEKVLGAVTLADQEVKDFFQANPNQFVQSAEVHARHILVDSEAKAKELLAQIQKGGDFAAIAKENSKDTGSAQNGGDLGFFAKGDMVAEFEQAAFALKPGQVSGIVKTQYGFHIIKCEEVKAEKKLTFDEVKDQIKEGLLDDKKQATWDKYVKDLRANAKVEIKL